MIKQQIETLINEISNVIPDDLQQAKQEMENNLRAALTASLAKLDLVTREEFDVQTALLQRARTQLDNMQTKIDELEKQLEDKN